MNSLLVLIAAICFLMVFYAFLRSKMRHNQVLALIFVCLYCLSLGLALRFGGRTYPGIYFPNSSFLNGLLNGNVLFVNIGYSAVLVAGIADSLQILMRPLGLFPATAVKSAKWFGVLLATTIALYGFYWAVKLQRVI